MMDILQHAIDLLKLLSFGFNNAVAIFIDDQIGEKAAGYWLFLSEGNEVSCQWLGATERTAEQYLKHLYEENLKDVRSKTPAGLIITMTELKRAADGYADSLTRFEEFYSDLLSVDTPQDGIEKLISQAKSEAADKMVERLLTGMFGGATNAKRPSSMVSQRDIDLNDFRNASLHRP